MSDQSTENQAVGPTFGVQNVILGGPWGPWGPKGAHWGLLGVQKGRIGDPLGHPWAPLGGPWGLLGYPWGALGCPWDHLGGKGTGGHEFSDPILASFWPQNGANSV